MEPAGEDWETLVAREVGRLHALHDLWLARELLRLARSVRRVFPDILDDPLSNADRPYFVWQLLPELARRLGARDLAPMEAARAALRTTDASDLREATGMHLRAGGLARLASEYDIRWNMDVAVLSNPVRRGNPAAFAAERLAGPPPRGGMLGDWIARQVRVLADENGHDDAAAWSPALLVRCPATVSVLRP